MGKPNILFIMTDQQRFDTIAALGNPIIRTPVLDRLVDEGTAFTSAYAPSPVCVASRCSILMGRYPVRTGCYDNGFRYPTDEQGFVARLNEHGYRTHGIGKCHFESSTQMWGFQSRLVNEEGGHREQDDYMTWLDEQGWEHVADPFGVRGEMYYIPQVSLLPESHHPTTWVADRSIDFLREQARSDQPWYLYTSFIHPHPPFSPPTPWHKLYRTPLMPMPHEPADQQHLWTYINRVQNRYKGRDHGRDDNLLRTTVAYYYACISYIDFQMSRIIRTLEETDQLDDTLILFTSDHGELLGDYGCVGKRSFHDAAARVPLLARWPERFAAGRQVRTPTSLVDVATTALTAAEAMADYDGDGVDLVGLADGTVERDAVFMQLNRDDKALCSVVTDRYKYCWSSGDDREYLIDRHRDPRESRNLAGSLYHRQELHDMRSLAIEHQRQHGDEHLLDGDGWKQWPPRGVNGYNRKNWVPRCDADLAGIPDCGLIKQDPVGFHFDRPGYTN